jgi:hypothetical protein
MQPKIRRTGWMIIAALAAVAVVFAVSAWLEARDEARVDLSRKLVGRWAAEGSKDPLSAGGPSSMTGAVRRVWTRSAIGFSFEGTSGIVSVPDSPELAVRGGQNFSVMAWIQPMRANNSFGVMSIVEKRKVGGIITARGFSLHLENGHLSCQLSPAPGLALTRADILAPARWVALWKGRNALAPANRFVSSGPDLMDGKFHHVALTLNRSSSTGGKLWVDGQVVLTFNPLKLRGTMVNSEPLLIGTHPDTTLQCAFKGQIEDVRFYLRCLSTKEIALAASQPAVKPKD